MRCLRARARAWAPRPLRKQTPEKDCHCEDNRRAKATQAVHPPCRSRRSSSTRRESATAATSARASAQAAQPPAQRAAAATLLPAAPAPAAAPGHAARPGAAASAASTSRIASSVAANSCARAPLAGRRVRRGACARLAWLPRCCKQGAMVTRPARRSHPGAACEPHMTEQGTAHPPQAPCEIRQPAPRRVM